MRKRGERRGKGGEEGRRGGDIRMRGRRGGGRGDERRCVHEEEGDKIKISTMHIVITRIL